jgi:hypothetical protein
MIDAAWSLISLSKVQESAEKYYNAPSSVLKNLNTPPVDSAQFQPFIEPQDIKETKMEIAQFMAEMQE